MRLDISAQTAARLVARAKESGLSVEVLLKLLLDDAGERTAKPPVGEIPLLPAWYLGVRGSLHRRDIYGDIS